jgi:multidrug resistance efflux pump
LAEFAKQLADSPERTVELGRIRGKATEFVVAQLDAKNAQVAHFESSLDKRLEDAVRIRFFEQRIAELEDEIDALHAQVDSQSANHEMYRQAARAAEEEKQAIVQLRERMQPTREEGPRPQVRKAA